MRFTLCLLLAMLIWTAGCATSKLVPDPLANWQSSSLDNLESNKVIMEDRQLYIQTLHLKPRDFVGAIGFFENGTGQHAVSISIGVSGSYWRHILIYDQANQRIKVMVYEAGQYRS
jgi:hypothetical protein